jgi:hypothetical protein
MVFDSTGNSIVGGTESGQANTIIGNRSNGILVTGTAQRVAIRCNVISKNGKIGINLDGSDSNYGVTRNDAFDADTGPNGLTNFPTVAVTGQGDAVKATISLAAAANREYAVDLFGVLASDVSGYGGADVYLGTWVVTTDASGKAAISKTVGATGLYSSITATATELGTQSTSEHGPNAAGLPIPRISVSVVVAEGQVSIVSKLRDRATDKGIAGAKVEIYVDNILKQTVTTGSDGSVTVTVPVAGLAPGSHAVSARFKATTKYGANKANGTFTIK